MTQQSPLDSRLASLGLLLGAGMIGYSYFKSRQGVGPLSAGPLANAAPGSVAAGGKRLSDLLAFADSNGLRGVSNAPGDYVLVPQPGWKWDVNGLAETARQQGFNATTSGGQVHVALPYEGQQ